MKKNFRLFEPLICILRITYYVLSVYTWSFWILINFFGITYIKNTYWRTRLEEFATRFLSTFFINHEIFHRAQTSFDEWFLFFQRNVKRTILICIFRYHRYTRGYLEFWSIFFGIISNILKKGEGIRNETFIPGNRCIGSYRSTNRWGRGSRRLLCTAPRSISVALEVSRARWLYPIVFYLSSASKRTLETRRRSTSILSADCHW